MSTLNIIDRIAANINDHYLSGGCYSALCYKAAFRIANALYTEMVDGRNNSDELSFWSDVFHWARACIGPSNLPDATYVVEKMESRIQRPMKDEDVDKMVKLFGRSKEDAKRTSSEIKAGQLDQFNSIKDTLLNRLSAYLAPLEGSFVDDRVVEQALTPKRAISLLTCVDNNIDALKELQWENAQRYPIYMKENAAKYMLLEGAQKELRPAIQRLSAEIEGAGREPSDYLGGEMH